MFCMLKKKKINPVYVCEHNSNRQKQVILLLISNGEGWHFLEATRTRRKMKNQFKLQIMPCSTLYSHD